MRAELNSIHQEDYLVRILGTGDQLRRLETGHGFAGAGGMPDVAAKLIGIFPFCFCNLIRNRVGGIVLIAAHHLKNAVRIVGDGIKSDKLVGHGNGKQFFRNILPVIQRFVVEVSPMKVKILIELAVRTGIGEIECFRRLHGDKDLNQRKETGENSFMGVFFDLIASLSD
ncbi:hypothetical protein SDC9_101845 [bioreactor metagenome]|uniref:Uncharacterized protein n=1 Tax=bioreactor metagenome TaxID=1076179 RepID=A0A645APP2_9ZZZZ